LRRAGINLKLKKAWRGNKNPLKRPILQGGASTTLNLYIKQVLQ